MEQRPKEPNTWLTRLLTSNEKDREFAKVVSLPIGDPLWKECTDEEKTAWEEAHKQEEPIEVEQ